MIGSIDCMHWQWKNCPTALQGDYGNRKGQKSIILEAVAGFDTWVWHAFFGVAGFQNDLNVLGQSPIFNDVLRGQGPNITYQVNNTVYQTGYYLADGIYLRWTTFVKSISNPRFQKQKLFATYQEGYRKNVERCFGILQARWLIIREGYRKDVERCFGILQARWAIIRGAARLFDEEVLRSIMMTCIILHNMIVEDEYDYDADDMYEPNPMDTALTQIYEKSVGPNEEPVQHEPLVRDGSFMPRMIDRYTEMQSSYIHARRQVDLMEHLWAWGTSVTPRTGSAIARYCPLWAWLHSHQPARFCFWELTKQLPRVVTHPGIAPASNSLNFGVPTNPKPVSSQKASRYEDARVVTHPGIAPASNSLNFGVPTNSKPVSSQKASRYEDARCAI
ncbi:hypothetical protein L3X38_016961 [Prunus dulcis]|uniref:Uncharacterized protein n=1 Tax=Prunus dulcis TaxID=3755 RepID=A0AAD4Z9B9_PRUDU|nr:hypothetical protein L3X38_016961 [Prunus dulcis]